MYFDRFDIVEAYYCYFADYHDGMTSRDYARLSKMTHYFSPRPNLSSDTLGDNGREIYENLVAKFQNA
jgi:hypothetical protein